MATTDTSIIDSSSFPRPNGHSIYQPALPDLASRRLKVKRTRWTLGEQASLSAECVGLLATNLRTKVQHLTKFDITGYHGFFSDLFKAAQRKVFEHEVHRVREVVTFSQVSWLMPSMLSLIREAKAESTVRATDAVASDKKSATPVASPDVLALAQQIAPLVVPLVLTQLAELLTRMAAGTMVTEPTPIGPPATDQPLPVTLAEAIGPAPCSKPRVLIFGLLNDQANEVESVWGSRFDLRFQGSESKKRCTGLGRLDYAIGMTSKMGHSTDKRLQTALRDKYIRVTGGVTSIQKALNDLNSKINLPH